MLIRGITYIDSTHYECDMIDDNYTNIYIYDHQTGATLPALNSLKTSPYITFSLKEGIYIINAQVDFLKFHTIKCPYIYPYNKIPRYYGATNNLKIFTKTVNNYLKQQKIPKTIFANLCPFTFGIEYETSIGVLPEEECFEKGLIPLRDGSITGNEYTTTILQGDKGLFLINEHFKLLNKYTDFNRDCSMHVHFGGFPLDKNAILALNNLCASLTGCLGQILPQYAFYTHKYKQNGKDYCKPLTWYDSFEAMYTNLTGMPFLGDFHQPHPNDIDKRAKWNIPTRYHMCNFINLLCYKGGKTVEFRFLKPTKNKHVLYFWLYILNALLLFAIKYKDLSTGNMVKLFSTQSLQSILAIVYPIDIATDLVAAIEDMKILRIIQSNNGDKCGEFSHFEDNFKLSKLLINYD